MPNANPVGVIDPHMPPSPGGLRNRFASTRNARSIGAPGNSPRIAASQDAETLSKHITFEIEETSAEGAEIELVKKAAREWVETGQWDALADYVTQAERSRAKTKGGARHRAILQTGALQILDAPMASGDEKATQDAMAIFQTAYAAAPRCPVRASLAARANLGRAWSVRGDQPLEALSQDAQNRIAERVERANAILEPFKSQGGAILGEARYRAAVLMGNEAEHLPPLYEDWAKADPEDAMPMEMHGFYLLPQWGGSYGAIELEARRAALRTEESIGFAGYTMLTWPLLEHDSNLLKDVDPVLFVEGLDDWMATCPEPGRVNTFLRGAVDIVNSALPELQKDTAIEDVRSHLAEAVPRLIQDHLRSVVLSAWDDDADWLREVIAFAYGDHIAGGGSVEITAKTVNLN